MKHKHFSILIFYSLVALIPYIIDNYMYVHVYIHVPYIFNSKIKCYSICSKLMYLSNGIDLS